MAFVDTLIFVVLVFGMLVFGLTLVDYYLDEKRDRK